MRMHPQGSESNGRTGILTRDFFNRHYIEVIEDRLTRKSLTIRAMTVCTQDWWCRECIGDCTTETRSCERWRPVKAATDPSTQAFQAAQHTLTSLDTFKTVQGRCEVFGLVSSSFKTRQDEAHFAPRDIDAA